MPTVRASGGRVRCVQGYCGLGAAKNSHLHTERRARPVSAMGIPRAVDHGLKPIATVLKPL